MKFLGAISKNYRIISFCFDGKPFNITVIQVYTSTANAEEAEVEWFYGEVQALLENNQKRCHFHYRSLEHKSQKQRDTWSNRKLWQWSTKRCKAKAGGVGPREPTGHSKHPLPTTKQGTLHLEITRWSTPKAN